MENAVFNGTKMVKFLFGKVDKHNFVDILLPLLFFVCLFSTTLFFFDSRLVTIFGYSIHLPIALTFFPATYIISNVVQDRKGRTYANTVVFSGFLVDIILVAMCWVLAHIGNRADYFSVFNALPLIMGSSLVFMILSSLLNIFIFEATKRLRQQSILGEFIGFFSSITAAEILITSLSMPLLFYHQGFKSGLILTISITVVYKLSFNLIATVLYVLYTSLKQENPGRHVRSSDGADVKKLT